jgi:hypothetical protein
MVRRRRVGAAHRARDVAAVETVVAAPFADAGAVGEEQLQRGADGGESQVVPRDLVFGEQAHVQAFDAGREIEVEQLGQIEQVDLVHVGHVQQREQLAQPDVGAGFFLGLAHRCLVRGFLVFHEAGRQGPVAVARLDGALAQQDLEFAFALPHWNRADHQLRVLVMNGAAMGAHVAWTVIAFGDGHRQRMGALGAEFHRKQRLWGCPYFTP